jgi:hypothetical protein
MDVVAEHHFAENRLERASFLEMIERSARSSAYITHHWQHEQMASPRVCFLRSWLKLQMLRIIRRRDLKTELLPYWEDRAFYHACFRHQFIIESARPRNYECLGLVKLRGLK